MGRAAPMRHAKDLTRAELEHVVDTVQSILWLDERPLPPHGEFWNPEKVWEQDFIEWIADLLTDYDLRPYEEAPVA